MLLYVYSLAALCLGTVTSQVLLLHQGSGGFDPCFPDPCGRNTRCQVRGNGAYCVCLPGFKPQPDTLAGCERECHRDSDCPGRQECHNYECEARRDPCEGVRCGRYATCEFGQCRCIDGYSGNPPFRACTIESRSRVGGGSVLSTRNSLTGSTHSHPCSPSPCGTNTDCKERNGRPICSCLPGYKGDPRTGCQRGECLINEDCPTTRSCVDNYCVNPCVDACGSLASCEVRRHVPVCSCPPGTVGDPSFRCAEEQRDPCDPNPCGLNTVCTSDGERAQCRCADNYIGSPLTQCRRECEIDNECAHDQVCSNYKCENPCENLCGDNAKCTVRNHRATCSCPEDFLGDPFTRCYPECVEHEECPRHKACFSFRCTDPCEGACGINANCEVKNHKAICSCPKDYVGHPFERCRRFRPEELCIPNPCGTNANCDPGKDIQGNDRPVCTCPPGYLGDPIVRCNRGECTGHEDCPDNRSCYNYICENPCNSRPCGVNAECIARNHGAVCRCPDGYEGDALSQCTLRRSRRLG